MRILIYLIHTFLDPLGIALGFLAGLLGRRSWQAGWGGAAAGAIGAAVVDHLHSVPITMRPTVTAAIVAGAWGYLVFRVSRWLRPRR